MNPYTCVPLRWTNTSFVHLVAFVTGDLRPMCAPAWERRHVDYRVSDRAVDCPKCLAEWKRQGR